MGKRMILVVSFGTSQKDARERAIGGIEKAIAGAFPDDGVRRAFTSRMVIRHIEREEGIHIPAPPEAIEQALIDGCSELIVQPTHMMAAQEYEKLESEVAAYARQEDRSAAKEDTAYAGQDKNSSRLHAGQYENANRSHAEDDPGAKHEIASGFEEKQDPGAEEARKTPGFRRVVLGRPILDTDEDFHRVICAIRSVTSEYDDGHTAIVLVGHGTDHPQNAVYGKMQRLLDTFGYDHYLVGTVEKTPSLEDIIRMIGERGYSRVVLVPLLVVAGVHALEDISGDRPESWEQTLKRAGYEVIVIRKGLGEYEGIQKLLVDHTKEAVKKASECCQ